MKTKEKVMWSAPILDGHFERMVWSMKKSMKERMFQKQQFWTAAIRPVLYGYGRKHRKGQSSSLSLLYKVVSRILFCIPFSISKIPIRLVC